MAREVLSVSGADYQLVVREEFDARYAFLFEPLQLERSAGTTVLRGRVVDQAQLHGYIERFEELGLVPEVIVRN